MGSVSAGRTILEAIVHSSQKCRGPVGSVCKQKACTLRIEKFLYHNCNVLDTVLVSGTALSACKDKVFITRPDGFCLCWQEG